LLFWQRRHLLIASNLFWWLRMGQLENEIQTILANNTLPSDDAVRWVSFLPVADDLSDAPVIICIWDVRTGTATLYTENMPPITEEQSYQLWLLRGEERVSAGVFQPSEDGSSVLVFDAPAPIGSFSAMGITSEPLGGSPQPTNDPVAQAILST
jgi:anti-sigma-K factor RskA